MTHYCSFHPLLPAHWECEHCKNDLCQRCVPEQGLAAATLRCPSCNYHLTQCASESSAISLWQRYRTILVLPLRKQSGAFLTSLLMLFGTNSLFNLPLYISLLLSSTLAFVYGSSLSTLLAKHSVRKNFYPPLKELFLFKSYRSASPILFVAVGSVGACVFLLVSQSFVVLAVVLTLLVFILPVFSAMQVGSERSGASSFVSQFFQCVARLGSNYIALCCWGLLISCVGVAVVDGLLTYTSSFVGIALAPVVIAYLILVWHSAVGLSVPVTSLNSDIGSRSRVVSLAASLEDVQLGIALREGKYDRVLSLLEGDYYRGGMTDYRLEQLYKLSLAQNRRATLSEYAAVFMSMLVRRGRDEDALTLLRTLRAYREDYRIADAQLCLKLVHSSERLGKKKLLLWLVQDAHRRFPQQQLLVAEMYRCAAKILHKDFKQNDKALAYMKKAVQARDMHESNESKTHTPL